MAGYVALADRVRRESRTVVESLNELDVMPVLLTGDHVATAKTIGKRLNVSNVIADCLPEDKMDTVAQLQQDGNIVAMVGDGVNDAPALKKSDVGIAMGGVGSDIAVEAADIVLVNDNIKEIPHLVALSKRMMTTIKVNLSFSLLLNFVAIILAMVGTLSPVWGALVHNGGSLLVVANSALLLRWAYKSNHVVDDDHSVLVKAARKRVFEA
ncbi:MAG: HAD-IC family P-type ATPase [Veillonella parvula]|uniref:HAD-IC family P-type ATPase n=1 Tax=Veillonella parvula TaxID=29466 RepID=UPI002900009D|nr:HAD-IC family P-type ATPase [Veillonella parvula]MDU2646997.1 HAD-IC family P-type ATPase [Veillonella parvula]